MDWSRLLVIAVDWSAADGPGPRTPTKNRVWFAAGTREQRDDPVYCRTRRDCIEQVIELLCAHPGPAIVGFDFALGYPLAHDGTSLMPTGRALCAWAAEHVIERDDHTTNRFEVANVLNAELARRLGAHVGPFWGTPGGRTHEALPHLSPTRPDPFPAPEYRATERYLRAHGAKPQSVWKLAYAGAVGSQTLVGLAWLHEVLTAKRLNDRCIVWPFEAPRHAAGSDIAEREIRICEIYPAVVRTAAMNPSDTITDAAQVRAVRDAILDRGSPSIFASAGAEETARREGWILESPRLFRSDTDKRGRTSSRSSPGCRDIRRSRRDRGH